MASLLYIPVTDPFAIFGMALLFILIIVAFVLLGIVARRSAKDLWHQVRHDARFQRLLQSRRKEEELSLRTQEEMLASPRDHPTIVVTAPSTASSFRSIGVRNKAYRSQETKASGGTVANPMATAKRDKIAETTMSSRATDHVMTQTSNTDYDHDGARLPRQLRIGQRYESPKQQWAYQKVATYEAEHGESPV